ncbi:MAG: ABC transporter permease [Spirochaetes bacterium]|jgi:ribose/xylose/arabinose/galactoside ABC-type transport system permease subunit|nr:ABC transporter permease [Spirochaetota bacterium]
MSNPSVTSRLRGFFERQGLFVAFIVVVAFFSIASDRFLSYTNIMLVLRQVSILGTIAIGMTLVIVAGNFDLSVGSLTSLTAVVVISMHDIVGPIPAMLITLLVGLASGTIAGVLVGKLRLNSLIITLGFLAALQAVTLIYTGGKYSRIVAPEETWFGFIGRGFVLGIPMPVIILGVLIIIFSIILTRTVFGRHILSVGGNSVASRFSGIRDSNIIMGTFIISGGLTAIAGILLGSRLMAAQNYLGQGYEFEVIAGVILGGTSLQGGEGNIFKAFIGILIIGILRNGFLLLGLPYYFQWVAQWVIVVGVVWIDVASRRGKLLA